MIVAGKLIEYLDNGKFICALVTESQPKRLRLLTQNGREVNLPTSRVVHCSTATMQVNSNRDDIIHQLMEITQERFTLMDQVDLEGIWELTTEENNNVFSPSFLAELTFGEDASDNTVSALLRCVFVDKFFFKFKEGKILANSVEKVEQLRIQAQKEAQKERLIAEGCGVLKDVDAGKIKVGKCSSFEGDVLKILRDYYLFGKNSNNAETARRLLKEAGMHGEHAPFHLLVKCGFWSEEENIPLLQAELPDTFSVPARQQAEMLLQSSTDHLYEDDARRDLTDLKPMTIDGPTTLDFDDALTVEKKGENFLVGIHISDVANYVRPGDPLFLEAMRRGTSIYFPERQIPMLPRHLSQGICSLIQDEVRAAFSFMILLSPEGEVLRVRIFPSIIKVARRLTYDQVDQMLESDEEIKILEMLRRKLRKRRLEAGALLLPFPDVNIHVDYQSRVHVSLARSDTPARTIVAEMMILANTEAAKYVADRMVPGLYRSQPPLKNRIVHGEDDDLYQNTLQRRQLPRGELSTSPKPHSGLGVNQYSTVTSPIRRLLDLVMQHQLNSIVRHREPCFTEEMCRDFTSVLARTLSAANNVRLQRQRFWLLRWLSERVGENLDALVIQAGPKRSHLLLTCIMMDLDLPSIGGVNPGDTVKVRVSKVEPIGNTVRFEWA
jgi:exoribonuclease-2